MRASKKLSLLMMTGLILASPGAFANGLSCVDIFADSAARLVQAKTAQHTPRTNAQAWRESVEALKQINQAVHGRQQVIEAMATAMLAKEFVWMNGEPGGAKTYLSRLMFQSAINSIPESEKRIFVLQFHKLISEGKITGFQKFSAMMKEGKYEIETSTSLVGNNFLYLIADEAEKSNPAVLNALLSVLNERKAFLGSKVVESLLASGVFTSNKTTGEFIQGFFSDRPSGEALLDRMAIKIHIPNQQMSSLETVAMYDMVKNPQKIKVVLPLGDLESLVDKVKIPVEMMFEIVQVARAIDQLVTDKANLSRKDVRYGVVKTEYFPANQFSNRSDRRLVQIFKAGLIAKQLMDGVPFEQMRLTPKREDLALLAKSALYVGPSKVELKSYPLTEVTDGKITAHGVQVKSKPPSSIVQFQALYSPYDNQIRLVDAENRPQFIMSQRNGQWVLDFKSANYSEWTIDLAQLTQLQPRIDTVMKDNNVDLAQPKFAIDNSIDRLLAKGTIKDRTRAELLSIKEDLINFIGVLDRQFEMKPPVAQAQALTSQKLLPSRSTKEKRAFRRSLRNMTQRQKAEAYYNWMVYEVKALKQRFVELDYSIEAHLTGLLAGSHLYVFGPPGGAKTALAEVIVKAELKKLNADEVDKYVQSTLHQLAQHDPTFLREVLIRMKTDKPKQFDRFLLQFHKLLPEGVLVGFPKIEKQLNEGKEEIETATSLAGEKFIFAILDEVDKANPQTITALLSILNEGEVFAGNTVIKTALRTAILTSNKMPSEFLDSYNEDRTTGDAVMDRAINKVYVSNKISTDEGLVQFLMNLEKGINPSWKGLLGVSELVPIVNEVEFGNLTIKEIMAKIHEKFLSDRISKEEETRKAHEEIPQEFPEYYVSAAGSASDRTFIKLMDQFKARFIIHQLMQGVEFKDLNTTIELKDLALFFEGMGYWAPQTIETSYNQEGVLTFHNDSHVIDQLINRGIVDDRVKYHVEKMKDEAVTYSQVINSVISDFIHEYREQIADYPDLFPGLFKDHP